MTPLYPWQWMSDDFPDVTIMPFRSPLSDTLTWEILFLPTYGRSATFRYICLRIQGTNDLFWLCDSGGNVFGVSGSLILYGREIRKICVSALFDGRLTRLYFLGQSRQLRQPGEATLSTVAIRADGWGKWNAYPPLANDWSEWPEDADEWWLQRPHLAFPLFEKTKIAGFAPRTAPDVWHQLETALLDPQSPASFARDWTDKTPDQRSATIWRWPHTERMQKKAELEEWLKIALLSDDELWQRSDAWNITIKNQFEVSFSALYGEATLKPLLRKLELLWEHFAPYNQEALKHECALHWHKRSEISFIASVRESTLHERLEARLRWQEWLASTGSKE